MALSAILKIKGEKLRLLKEDSNYAARLEAMAVKAGAAAPPRDFLAAISGEGLKIIAEVKKASPSKGIIREEFDPLALAREYEQNGASAISVLTEEEFFLGKLEYIKLIKGQVKVPLLRKDFILDEYQVYESGAAGADAVLLICAILAEKRLVELITLTEKLSMTALVEVHTRAELDMAIKAGARLIGINNRDLKTFKTDIEMTRTLAPLVPEGTVIVSESGIKSAKDITGLMGYGVNAFLIGETLAREKDAGAKLRALLSFGKKKVSKENPPFLLEKRKGDKENQ